MGVGLGRTTLMSSLLHSRTDHSSSTRARIKPETEHGEICCTKHLFEIAATKIINSALINKRLTLLLCPIF